MANRILQVGDDARVRYALRLANADDVTTLGIAKVAALWTGQRRFMGLPPDALGNIPGIGMPEMPAYRTHNTVQLQRMQDSARELLSQVSAGIELTATFDGRTTITGERLAFSGPAIEVFRITLAMVLASAVGQRVLKCPECGRYFERVGRQKYCGDRCTDKATWRNYSPAKKRRAREKEYAKYGWTVGARSKRISR
jgi:hypothetical protein